MCTVTIVPKGNNDFILTSNRDEAPNRVSRVPEFYELDGVKVLFPMDEQSGGTWIGVSETKRLVCVLNGGFVRHQQKPFYRKSRGVVAKDLLVCDTIKNSIETYDFFDIEPFTMIIADWNIGLSFFELVWDGNQVHFNTLPLEHKVWSSSTLYTASMKLERANWFDSFKSENELNGESLLQFHKTAGTGNLDYGVIMDRGFVKTTSITQVEKFDDLVNMYFENLQKNIIANKQFNPVQTINE
jgi:hypothetical protein